MIKMINNCLFVIATLCLTATISSCRSGGGDGSNSTGGTGGGTDDSPSKLSAVCPRIIDLNSGMNVKYKSQNVHGGRGPSFILGCQSNARQYWPVSTYLATFPIYSVKGNEIGRFVVYDPGHRPYGNRSYTGLPGGSPPESSTLMNNALADGSSEIYINVRSNICFKVNDPTVNQGTIGAVDGRGSC